MSLEVTPKLKRWLREHGHAPDTFGHSEYETKAVELFAEGELTAEKLLELTEDEDMSSTLSPEKMYGGGGRIDVKRPSEAYSEKRYTAKHAKTGESMVDPIYQRECQTMSEAAKARHGVLLKHLARRAGVWTGQLTEHEENLLGEVCLDHAWCGKVFDQYEERFHGDKSLKALIDDAPSGGLEVVPIEFDADVITFPLLHGELFPQVDLKPVPRGRRIEGASISTPTLSWGGGDDSSMSLFNTASMVAAIDTTIFTVDGAIEVGRDFLSDSPVNVGATLTALVGERLTNELDKIVANGNGTTQPTGLFQAAGVSTVAADSGAAGPPTVNDYLSLLFALAKQYRRKEYRVAFVSNDMSYQRSRQIKIDTAAPSTDQRPALSPLSVVNDYATLGWPHKIENNLGNTALGIAAMSKYRMYRRLGLEIRFESGGKELARKNLTLLIYRARFGGKLMDSNAFVKMTGVQS